MKATIFWLIVLAGLCLKAYCQQWAVGFTRADTVQYHWMVQTKTYPLSLRTGVDFITRGYYVPGWMHTELGVGLALGKFHIRNYVVKNEGYYYKVEFGYKADNY